MFVTNWISTTKIQKISEITNFFRHYFLSRTEVILYSKFPHESNFGATDLSRGGVRVGNIIHATCFYLSEQRKAEIILQEIADDNQGLMFQLRTQKSKVVWTSK